MKILLAFAIALQGCAVFAGEPVKPPSGEIVFDILLKNSNLPLKNEPLCNMSSATRNSNGITLGEHLATIFSVSYESNNTVALKSSCELSKVEEKTGKVIDAWDCKLEMLETNKAGEFISSAMVAFSISLDKTRMIYGSLRCF